MPRGKPPKKARANHSEISAVTPPSAWKIQAGMRSRNASKAEKTRSGPRDPSMPVTREREVLNPDVFISSKSADGARVLLLNMGQPPGSHSVIELIPESAAPSYGGIPADRVRVAEKTRVRGATRAILRRSGRGAGGIVPETGLGSAIGRIMADIVCGWRIGHRIRDQPEQDPGTGVPLAVFGWRMASPRCYTPTARSRGPRAR